MFVHLRSVGTYILAEAKDAPRGAHIQMLGAEAYESYLRLQFFTSDRNRARENETAIRHILTAMRYPFGRRTIRQAQLIQAAAQYLQRGFLRLYDLPTPFPTPAATTPHPVQATPLRTSERQPYEIRFQICPGTAPDIGIAGLPFIVWEGTTELARGVTGAAGQLTVEMAEGEALTLEILGNRYELRIVPELPSVPLAGRFNVPYPRHAAVKRRLELLGYLTGYLREAVPNSDTLSQNDQDDPRAHQAIQNFQADQRMESDGEIGDGVWDRLTQEVGG
jgi:hypothetical protein